MPMTRTSTEPSTLNTIVHGDCVEQMNRLPAASVDLVFADPPFNIGYDYDVYNDSMEGNQYLAWSREWIAAVHRVLKARGTFWLAIGDEYAAELKLASQEIGFHCRSWVIWYYTFGVNCSQKFTRSHAHLFYFVKDPSDFTFRADDLNNRIPSARQLVYNDKRANPRGRLPDDTWILRPQDISECFQASEDTWYVPRVAGTFKERAGFHGCQMPEQLLGRIIRSCSESDDLVLDPFSGSATTLAVAKKLGRRFLGFDLSEEYIRYGQQRLASIRVGDPLDGSPEPTMGGKQTGTKQGKHKTTPDANQADTDQQMQITLDGLRGAFGETHNGYSADRLVADPALNENFITACRQRHLVGEPRIWNSLLFRLRKSGDLVDYPTTQPTKITWTDLDEFLFASEIAWQTMLDDDLADSLDEILCDPTLATEFDTRAQRCAPGHSPFEYRWGALKIRKEAKSARSRGGVLQPPRRLSNKVTIEGFDPDDLPNEPGVYLVTDGKKKNLYAGWALNLQGRLAHQFAATQLAWWQQFSGNVCLQTYLPDSPATEMPAWQSCLIEKYRPLLNLKSLSTD